MPRNTKLVLGICHSPNTLSQMSQISNFISPISKIISPYIINQSDAIVENQINNALHALSKDLYLSIHTAVLDFDIPIQTL